MNNINIEQQLKLINTLYEKHNNINPDIRAELNSLVFLIKDKDLTANNFYNIVEKIPKKLINYFYQDLSVFLINDNLTDNQIDLIFDSRNNSSFMKINIDYYFVNRYFDKNEGLFNYNNTFLTLKNDLIQLNKAINNPLNISNDLLKKVYNNNDLKQIFFKKISNLENERISLLLKTFNISEEKFIINYLLKKDNFSQALNSNFLINYVQQNNNYNVTQKILSYIPFLYRKYNLPNKFYLGIEAFSNLKNNNSAKVSFLELAKVCIQKEDNSIYHFFNLLKININNIYQTKENSNLDEFLISLYNNYKNSSMISNNTHIFYSNFYRIYEKNKINEILDKSNQLEDYNKKIIKI